MLIRTAPRFWSWGWHWFEKFPFGCRDMAISMCLAPNMFQRHREFVVETEQMSSVETGKMSSVETRQMSQQQTSVLSQQQTSVLSQQKTSVLSQQQILSASEICRGPDTSKWPDLDNRKVTFQTDGTPKSRIAVRFQWAWSRGELLKN